MYLLFQGTFKLIKKLLFKPIITIVDKFYQREVHSKHEKIAKNVDNMVCTPSAFLDKPRKEQVEVLATDIMLVFTNISLIYSLHYVTTNFWSIPSLTISEILFTFFYTYIATDFTSGIIHFTLDNPATKNHPLYTVRNLAYQFQDHHDKPYDNTLPPLLHVLCNFSFAIIPPLFCNFIYSYLFGINMVLYSVLIYIFVIFGQYVHRSIHYTHSERSKWIIFLMDIKCIQRIENHHLHHKTFDCYYTTLAGWCDPLIHYLKSKLSTAMVEKTDWFAVTMYWSFLIMPSIYIYCMKMVF